MLTSVANFETTIIADIWCQHSGTMWLLTFQELVIASSSGNYDCEHFCELKLLAFRKCVVSDVLESIIDEMVEHIVTALKTH